MIIDLKKLAEVEKQFDVSPVAINTLQGLVEDFRSCNLGSKEYVLAHKTLAELGILRRESESESGSDKESVQLNS